MKKVLITGGTKGIGKALTEKYLSEGYFVISVYANDDKWAEKLKKELNINYENMFELIKLDLSNITNVYYLCEYIEKNHRKLNNVIINAGVTNRTSFKEITLDEWSYVMDVNINMPFFIIKGISDFIVDNGSIIFIGSLMGIYPHAMSVPYAVSKAGLHMLSKQLVKYFVDRQITVNTIAPGFVETPWQKTKPTDQRKRIENKTAMKRFAEPEEIAKLCWDVCQNRFINGSILQIDGGYCYE